MPAKKIILYSIIFLLTASFVYFALNFFLLPAKPKAIFLKVVGLWEPSVFNAVKSDFQAKNPEITIEYEKRNSQTYFQNLSADLKTENTPDVFWWHSGWGLELKDSLAILPENVMSTSEFEKTFYPIVKSGSKVRNAYRGFPLEFESLALLYNKSLLGAINVNSGPSDWHDLIQQYVPSLTKNDGKRILNSAIALGSSNNVENVSEIIGLFLLQSGVEFTKNNELFLNNNIAADNSNLASSAIDFYYKFSLVSKTWDNTLPNSIEAFAQSKTAMILLPSSKIHNLLSLIKKENLSLNFGVQPVPQLPNRPKITWGNYWSLGVSEQSKQKEAAWKLAKFLTEPEALRVVYKLESEQNSFGRVYPRVDMAREQTTNQYLAAYVAQAPTAKTWYLNSDTSDQAMNDQVVAELKKALASVEKKDSTDRVVKNLTDTLSPILQKYGLITGVAPPVKN